MSERPVLLVEDDPDDLLLARMVFEARGDRPLLAACDGAEALSLLGRAETAPALIVLDLNLPGMSGFELLRLLGDERRWRRIPVVVLSSSDLRSDHATALRLGARACFRKPNGYKAFERMAHDILAHADPE